MYFLLLVISQKFVPIKVFAAIHRHIHKCTTHTCTQKYKWQETVIRNE